MQSNEEPKQQIDKKADDTTLSKSEDVHIRADCMETIRYVSELQFEFQQK